VLRFLFAIAGKRIERIAFQESGRNSPESGVGGKSGDSTCPKRKSLERRKPQSTVSIREQEKSAQL